jgi:hypothetical protein
MEEQKQESKNTFREELAKKKLTETKLFELNAKVEYLQRKTVKEINDMDIAHVQSLIEKIHEHTNRLFELPDSPAREFYLQANKQQTENLKQQIEKIKIKDSEIVVLAVLKEKFEGTKNGEEK